MIAPQKPSPVRKQLSSMSQAVPGQNAMVANQMQAARTMQMQNAISQAATAKGPAQAQAIGTQQAQAAGQIATQQQASNIGQSQRIGQAFIADRKRELDNTLRQKSFANTKRLFDEEQRLEQLDARLKKALLDDTFKFQEDDLGRTLFNERQLLDYKIATAKDDNALLDYEQQVTQESRRRSAMLEVSYTKVRQALQQEFEKGEQDFDQAQRQRLLEAKNALEKKMAAEKNKAKNRAALFSSGGSLLGMGAVLLATGGTAAPAYVLAAGTAGAGGGNILAGTTKI
jgi:hypothetical protein